MGRWLMQVPWLERTNFSSGYESQLAAVLVDDGCASAVTDVTTPAARGDDDLARVARRAASMPVPTIGDSGSSSGTAWRCMLEPMRARLASSCSRNGMSAVATDTICLG